MLAVVLAVFYARLMWRYRTGFLRLLEWHKPKWHVLHTRVTVIIPARNEADNIRACLTSILANDYPDSLLQIIVVDDHSTDDTATRVLELEDERVLLLSLADYPAAQESQAFKKQAITYAMAYATGRLIFTTDADCVAHRSWLATMVSYYEVWRPRMMAGVVQFHREESAFERFQSLDFLGMIGIAAAGIELNMMRMCNGANLAYEKAAFEAVGGYEGVDDRASGDDMLLMHKVMARFPEGVAFVKHPAAGTYTVGKPDLRSFYQQRLRWATKSAGYQERQLTVYLGMVWLFCVSIGVTVLLLPLYWGALWPLVLLQLTVKMVSDYRYLGAVSRYFGRRDLMRGFARSSVYHWVYIVVVGLAANVVQRYEWKGRAVR